MNQLSQGYMGKCLFDGPCQESLLAGLAVDPINVAAPPLLPFIPLGFVLRLSLGKEDTN